MPTHSPRVVTASEAAATLRPGERVFVGSACATPRALLRALDALEDPPSGVQLIHYLTDGSVGERGGIAYSRFRHRAYFVGRDVSSLGPQGKLDYVPLSAREIPRLLEIGRLPIDVALVQVSAPDAEGSCSLGVSVDVTWAAIQSARRVIAEINPRMPRTRGTTSVPLSRFELVVEVDTPVIEYVHEPADDVAEKIARFVARIIDDGSTLQIGLGRIPNEMLRYLTSRHDLGVHSDVITEPLVDLIEKGVVTGARKTSNPGLVVTSFCMGTRRLYDLVHDNPMFSFRPIDVVADPVEIAAQEKMVSVTQAFAVDLTGQVCSDQYHGRFYGGVAAQADFVRGTAASKGGKPIICLASTTDDGQGSRIVPTLGLGEGVTLSRADVHYVVTEWGTAYLFGKSISERAVALIEVADPRFREALLEGAKRLGYLSSDVKVKSRAAYPVEEERAVTLKDGADVRIRPTRAGDVELIQSVFYGMTERDIYTRFFTNLKSLSVPKAQHLCSVNYEGEMAYVAVQGDAERERAIGSACYFLNPTTNLADVAFMIRPEWQGKGLASTLLRLLMAYAKARGVRGLTADVLVENGAMVAVFEKSGATVTKRVVSGAAEITMLFGPGDS